MELEKRDFEKERQEIMNSAMNLYSSEEVKSFQSLQEIYLPQEDQVIYSANETGAYNGE